jgi:hypothetical protein
MGNVMNEVLFEVNKIDEVGFQKKEKRKEQVPVYD